MTTLEKVASSGKVNKLLIVILLKLRSQTRRVEKGSQCFAFSSEFYFLSDFFFASFLYKAKHESIMSALLGLHLQDFLFITMLQEKDFQLTSFHL